MKKNKPCAIMTSSDSKYGDFLVNHWLKSLKNNIDNNTVDIIVFNYGLTKEQKKYLINKKVIVVDCIRDGLVNNLRFKDMLNFLNQRNYSQVMSCDGGDIIFQDNIMNLFTEKKDEVKVVVEELFVPFNELFLFSRSFESLKKEVLKKLKNKKVINSGMIVSPATKFKKICSEMNLLIENKNVWGPDQVILNYLLYRDGFYPLEEKYNFVISTTKERFKVKEGIFLDKESKPIKIVHNAGGKDFNRPIKNFGYGENCNKLRIYYYFLRTNFLFGSLAIIFMRRLIKIKLKIEKLTKNGKK